jgi:hypothetical protein
MFDKALTAALVTEAKHGKTAGGRWVARGTLAIVGLTSLFVGVGLFISILRMAAAG